MNKKIIDNITQFLIKKGDKAKVEKLLRRSLEFHNKAKNKNLKYHLKQSSINLQPYIMLKTKRIRGRNSLMPTVITKNHSNFLKYSWLTKGIGKQSEKTFPRRFTNALESNAEKKGWAIEKQKEMHKTAFENVRMRKK